MQFQVDLEFDVAGLAKIAGQGQFVTVFRSVTAVVGTAAARYAEATFPVGTAAARYAEATFPVAWLAFQPLATANVLIWTDAANLYAAAAAPAPGGVIAFPFPARTHGLTPGLSSTLCDGAFRTAGVGPDPSAYRAVNAQRDFFCFGLIGEAFLNGVPRPHRPMNIQSTLLNEAVDFILDPGAITIALTNIGTDGTMMPVEAGGLPLTLSGASPTAKVGFDDSTNEFFLIGDDWRCAALTREI
ncbi:MAG TPA: hypothetical protein VF432_17515 [Thermoanaerobaculia bacterium]